QRPAPPRQRREAFPERRVQALDVGRIDDPIALRAPCQRLDACRCAIDNAALGLDDTPPLIAFDHLGDQDVAPRTQAWSSPLARAYGIAKGLPNSPDVGHQAIGTDQHGATCRPAPHPFDQPADQGQITLLADLTAQPQTRLDHHGERHPHDAALFLDTEFIRLHLSQVPWLFDQVFVHHLTLSTRASPPISHRPLVKSKRRHNRLHGTAMGQQGHDEDDGFCRGAQPIEDRAFGGAEGFVARVTDEALLLARMDSDVALADMTSGRTVLVGAEYCRGVHDAPPGCAWKTLPREVCLDPRLLDNFTAPRFGVELSHTLHSRKTHAFLRLSAKQEK